MGLSSAVATFARVLAAMLVAGAQANRSGAVDAVSSAAIKGLHAHGIGHYETFHLDPNAVAAKHERHQRSRRSMGGSHVAPPLTVGITAHGRTLELRLSAAESNIFTSRFTASSVGGPSGDANVDVDRSVFYHGHLADEEGATRISAFVDHGDVLVGTIFSDNGDDYIIERADKYLGASPGHSNIIYRASDVVPNEQNASVCGEQYSKLKELQAEFEDVPARHRRQEDTGFNASRTACGVKLVADHRVVANMAGVTVEERTRNAIMTMISLLDSANLIYQSTLFDVTDAPRAGMLQLMVARAVVFPELGKPCEGPGCDAGQTNPFTDARISCDGTGGTACAQKFLNVLSEMDGSDEHCLVHGFSNSDFDGGVLGLAFVGRPGGNAGLCGRRSNGRNLNTGIVTMTNFGKAVSRQVQVITLAHEFGHNIGSSHDVSGAQASGTSCAPGGNVGNFVMYVRATDGDRGNNNKFSTCSVNQMSQVIRANADCLESRDILTCGEKIFVSGSCGNGVLDFGEECDCLMTGPDPHCDCDTCQIVAGKQCSKLVDMYCCSDDGMLFGKSFIENAQVYRKAIVDAVIEANGTLPQLEDVNSGLATVMDAAGVPKCPAEDSAGCKLDVYCVADREYVPFKGQIFGSCPQSSHVIPLWSAPPGSSPTNAPTQAPSSQPTRTPTLTGSQSPTAAPTSAPTFEDGALQNTGNGNPLEWNRDLTVPDVCQTYDADPADEAYFLDPGGRRILSCVQLILDWRSGRNTNPVEYCHVYELTDSSFCNQKQNLCRRGSCAASICSQFDNDDLALTAARCSVPRDGDDSCKLACTFNPANPADCLPLDSFIRDAQTKGFTAQKLTWMWGIYNNSVEVAGGNLAPGRSCRIDGDEFGGRCTASGSCEALDGSISDVIDFSAVQSWFEDNSATVGIVIGVIVLVILALRCTYSKNKEKLIELERRASNEVSRMSDKFRGRIGVAPKGLQAPKGLHELQQDAKMGTTGAPVTSDMRDRLRRKIKHETQVLRLQALFPKAKRSKLEWFAKIYSNEAQMVKNLLRGGVDKGGGSASSPTEMVVPDRVPLVD